MFLTMFAFGLVVASVTSRLYLLMLSIYRDNFGYTALNWRNPASMENKYVRKRAMQLQVTLQCGAYISSVGSNCAVVKLLFPMFDEVKLPNDSTSLKLTSS